MGSLHKIVVIKLEFSKALLLLNINVSSDDVIYNTVINTNEDTLSSTCEHIFDLLQKFWLDSELEPATPGPV